MLPPLLLRSKLAGIRLINFAALSVPLFFQPIAATDSFFASCSSAKDSCKVGEPCTMAELTNPTKPKEASSIYDFSALDIKGNVISLEKYRGHVAIIVNVASQCGYTKNNYAELQDLFDKYGESKGLRVLAFPCNQFGGQESGSNTEICEFVSKKNVSFDMFDKIDVNGGNAHPLYTYLKQKQGGTLGDFIKWNFTKFVIDKNGQPVERHGPSTNPKDMENSLLKYLDA